MDPFFVIIPIVIAVALGGGLLWAKVLAITTYPHFEESVHEFLYFDDERIRKAHGQLPGRSTDADVELTRTKGSEAQLAAVVGAVSALGKAHQGTTLVERGRREHTMEERHNELRRRLKSKLVRGLDNPTFFGGGIGRLGARGHANRLKIWTRGSPYVALDGPLTVREENDKNVVFLRTGPLDPPIVVECERALFVEEPARVLTGPVGVVGKLHGRTPDGALLVRALSIFR